MSEVDDYSAPAHPTVIRDEGKKLVRIKGMSLHQYYAAHCPITLTEAAMMLTNKSPKISDILEKYADLRFMYADSMIEAYKETEGESE